MRIHRAANQATPLCLCIVIFLCFACGVAFAQQSYAGLVGDCSIGSSTTTAVRVGYTCSEAQPTCQTYAYYRTQQGQTLSDVASRFDTTISALTEANALSTSSAPSADEPLFIPLSCSCDSKYSVMEVPYTIQSGDSFSRMASSTFEGLTTCGGIQTFNPSVAAASLQAGSSLIIPLRCACPSQEQLDEGIELLITYPIVTGDDPSKISSAFGTDLSHLQAANSLSQSSVIQPQTTVLIPLAQKPQTAPVLEVVTPPPPPSPTGGKSSHVGMYVGIAIGVCVAVALIVLAAFFYLKKGKSAHDTRLSEAPLMIQTDTASLGADKYEIDMSDFNKKLCTYSAEEIGAATQGFNKSHHVKGLVYCGVLREQTVAIKKVDRNISEEVSTFRNLHHSNLVLPLGVCIGSQESFLVYPFIGDGSLKDWLHNFPRKENPHWLGWCKRVQIAEDIVIALDYLHNYTKPKLLHKNVTSSNILVDANHRGKLANFGLSKSTEDMEQGMAWTSHIEGTQGYLAPEYVNDGEVSAKTDVFAFGVVLAEMLSGEDPIMRDIEGSQLAGKYGFLWEYMTTIPQENLVNWMDPMLKGKYPIHCAMKILVLAKRCVAKDPASRPSMSAMAAIVKDIMEVSQKWEREGAHDES